MSTPIRVVVVDDHPVVREGVSSALRTAPDITVVGQAADGAEAVALLATLAADVVLMDLRMPVMDGVEATRRLLTAHPGLPVVVLTTYESDADILSAIEAGATGYLLKAAPMDELLAGVRAAVHGQVALSPSVATALVTRTREPASAHLTPREIDVLELVAEGRTNGQIATALHISEATVKTHLLRIFEKLGVNDRTRAVTLALEKGILRG
ncbi:response regulator transcription factor [Raineyella sp. W15-4]|uniref:response regulator transcription factor n=1 Tax=Raineyella sp. W15-4 TaxID=3081651 RepID=UPI002954458F|nr:response regulator transcription factor [Raineyella sp. W15-4]WOQ17325.1 response regulator transcription factor [Raineyella sp. W15-4]